MRRRGVYVSCFKVGLLAVMMILVVNSALLDGKAYGFMGGSRMDYKR